jgi:hypothetical protein
MNKTVISELNRIKELMGKPLILEQVWKPFANDVVKFVTKNLNRQTITPNIEKLIKDLTKSDNDKEIIGIISKLIDESDEISRVLVPKILSTLTDVETAWISNFRRDLKKRIVDKTITPEYIPKYIDAFISQKVKTNIDEIKNILKKDLIEYAKNVKNSIDSATDVTPLPKKPTTITDVVGQQWENIKPLSNEEILELEKTYRKKGLGKSFVSAMRLFGQNVIDMMTKQFKLMDETLSLIKTASIEENSAKKLDILKRIGENMKTLTQRDLDNFAIIDEWIDMNIDNYKFKVKIKNLDGYTKAASLFDNTTLKKWKESYKSFWDRRSNLLKQTNSMLNPASYFKPIMKKRFGQDGNGYWGQVANKWMAFAKGPEYAELRRYILLGQTQDLSGIKQFRKDFGFLPAVANVGKEWVYSYVALAAMLGFVDYVTDIMGNVVRNFSYVNDNLWVKEQIESYDKYIMPDESESKVEKAIKGYGFIFGDLLNYTWDELKDLSTAFPGVMDDFGQLFYNLRNGEVSKEDAEKIEAQGNKLKKDIKDEMVTIEAKPSDVVNDIDEDDFRRWCENQNPKKEFVRYDEGIGTTFEEGKEKYWYFDTDTNTFEENKPE